MASKVESHLTKKELADWFMDTVQIVFYEMMVSSLSVNFSDLVVMGIKIKLGMNRGKMTTVVGTFNKDAKKFSIGFQKKNEGDTNVVSINQGRIHSWKKQQQQFSYQQHTYPM